MAGGHLRESTGPGMPGLYRRALYFCLRNALPCCIIKASTTRSFAANSAKGRTGAAMAMTANAADFAGSGCGRRYEKELETHFRDCLLFYLDGRIRFERYCYGEAACLVFSVWAHGFDADGNILWDREPEFESQKTAIPRVLTDIQEDGNALQFDGAFKRYVKTEEFDEDKPNGYGKFKVFWLKRKK